MDPVKPEPSKAIFVEIRTRGGARDRYYHFLLGYLAPLVRFLAEQPAGRLYAVRSCGLMDQHLVAMGFENVEVIPRTDWQDRLRQPHLGLERLQGFDTSAFYDADIFDDLRKAVIGRLGVEVGTEPGGVTFINRGRSPDYYQSDQSEGYGAAHGEGKISADLRRSVPNMPAIFQTALERGKNARLSELETSTLREQAALFANSRTVVAQHGAALANMIWMPRGSLVVEINPKPPADPFIDCFRDLAATCGHRYVGLRQAGRHGQVDPALVLSALDEVNSDAEGGSTRRQAPAHDAAGGLR